MSEPSNDDLLAELRQVQRVQSEFVGNLVHELRNSLAPVMNGLELLRRGGGDEMVREQAVGMIERQVGLISRLLEGLAETAKKNG